MADELPAFVSAAKRRGASDDGLLEILIQRGWSEKAVMDALARYYEAETGMAVPSPPAASESAREAFLYLLSFASLATWISALGSLLFALISHHFPDPVTPLRAGNEEYNVSGEIAAIIVAFPLYLFTMRLILRATWAVPEAIESRVRAWLTYLSMLVAAGIVIGDLINFLAFFLRGELSGPFFLKTLVVLILAGTVFWYYLSSVRRMPRRHAILAAIASVVVAVAVVAGFLAMGSREHQRDLQADRRRIENLEAIDGEVRAAWRRDGSLPSKAGESHADPIDNRPYTYRPSSGSAFELCATFSGPAPRWQTAWPYHRGETCFSRDAAR
jgi:hypothetical protein